MYCATNTKIYVYNRCRDFENNYHWFLMNERILGERYVVENRGNHQKCGTPFIDPASYQYDYKEVPPPTNTLTSRLLDGSYSTGECLEALRKNGATYISIIQNQNTKFLLMNYLIG